MPCNRLSQISTTVKLLLGELIIDGQLNPVHLAIGRRGYGIQSRTLRIPDRCGWFSPGPARLQAEQGFLFFWLCVALVMSAGHTTLEVVSNRAEGLPVLGITWTAVSSASLVVIVMWIVVCFDRRRSSGYKWVDDWKLQIA